MRLRTILICLAVLGFIGFLAWTSLAARKVTCEVCVTFGGGDRCAKAAAETRQEATRSAQATACGPLARGMDATIGCGRTTPRSVTCNGG